MFACVVVQFVAERGVYWKAALGLVASPVAKY